MNELSIHDLVRLEIEDLAFTGKSVARHNGFVVMVDQGLPGELVECEVIEVRRRYAVARALRQLRAAPNVVEPRCLHFGSCGGCNWQNLPYSEQLRYKARFVQDALERIGKLKGVAIDPPIGCGEQFFYRNKMEYSFGTGASGPAAGLHIKGRYDEIFELEHCYLQSERSVTALRVVRDAARELGIPFIDEKTHEGELRFLVVREGKFTGDLMLNIVTMHREFAGRHELFRRVIAEVAGLTSLYHTVNGRKAHIAVGEELILVYGSSYLTERLGDLLYYIAPFSFFQTNSRQAVRLYDLILEHAALDQETTVLDLFCGCGTISLYLAQKVKSVVGVEINPEAVEMAKLNAQSNSITNATFSAGDARRLLGEMTQSGQLFDVVIVDPPRAGLDSKLISRLVRLQPRRIVAVSCNPATLARDLAIFSEHGYSPTRITPVDMFPQTAHIETVVTLLPGTEPAQANSA